MEYLHDTPATPSDDQAFLDWVFERAVQQVESGMVIDLESLLGDREHLRGRVEELVRVARGVAIGPIGPIGEGMRPAPRVAGYSVLEEIGSGGMGTVYLARQVALGGRPVALKLLPSQRALTPRSRQRFREEANAIAKLRHPHIVAVHDVVHDGETQAYAMEWVEGSSLARVIDHLAQQRTASVSATQVDDTHISLLEKHLNAPAETFAGLTWPVYVIRLGIAIARALETVHRAGLLHRDVKPSNILIRRDGAPLLSDFGLVREVDATVTQPGSFAGTAAYAAPEQLRGDADRLDGRADVYSLGVTLYHALALRMPFSGHSATHILQQIERAAAPPLRRLNRKLPVDLQTVIATAMEAEPARRYANAEGLADDLERLLKLQPIRARPAGVITRALKFARRNRAAFVAAIVGGALSLVLAALAVVYTFFVPRWVAGHVTEARMALLDPEQSNAIFLREYWGESSKNRKPPAQLAPALAAALQHYDAALRLAPFDQEIRTEREVVGSCRSNHAQDARATRNGRAAGLYAFLMGDTDKALEAWLEYEKDRPPTAAPDPLVEAALGMLYVVRGEAARGYPRLQRAAEAFPDAGFIHVYFAEAALRCGDVDRGEQILQLAEKMNRQDRFRAEQRVRALLLALRGKDADAEAAYRQCRGGNPIAGFEFGQFLMARDRTWEAAGVFRELAAVRPDVPRAQKEFVAAMDLWWAGLDVSARWNVMIAALDATPDSIVPRLRTYVECRQEDPLVHESFPPLVGESVFAPTGGEVFPRDRVVPKSVTGAGIRSGDGVVPESIAVEIGVESVISTQRRAGSGDQRHGYGPLPDGRGSDRAESSFSAPLPGKNSSAFLQRANLSDFARIMEVQNMERWNRVRTLPRWLKGLQLFSRMYQERRATPRLAVLSWAVAALTVGFTEAPVFGQVQKNFEFEVDGVLPSTDPDTVYCSFTGQPEVNVFSVSGGILHQTLVPITGVGTLYRIPDCTLANGPLDPAFSFSASAGVQVLQTVGDPGAPAAYFQAGNGVNRYGVFLTPSGPAVLCDTGNEEIPGVSVSDYHEYRLESPASSSEVRLYIDGVLAHVCNAASATFNGFEWGGGNSDPPASSDAEWYFVRISSPSDCEALIDCNKNGLLDECDIANETSVDCDGNSVPDDCQLDTDSDGTIDGCDNCPDAPNTMQEDDDVDGVGDVCDNCPDSANFDQADLDSDGQGDACDPDDDNDGVGDAGDVAPLNPGVCQDVDGDGCDDCSVGVDGLGPLADNDPAADGPDGDADTICDAGDNCPGDPNTTQEDDDADGMGNVCDVCPGFDDTVDPDADGRPTGCDNCSLANPDQADCEPNGTGDVCDIAFCTACSPACQDCNRNGVPDLCDIASGSSFDVDPPTGNGIPDECESCPADVNVDGSVNPSDLALLLGAWGPCPVGQCPADLNGDCVVNASDLALLLGAWGNCP